MRMKRAMLKMEVDETEGGGGERKREGRNRKLG